MLNRREFLRDACAVAAASGLSARIWGAAETLGTPDLRLGLLSDIHISLGPKDDPVKATAMFRHALEYFRDRHVDGVLVSGDLANAGLVTELKAVADAWFAVFPDGKLPDGSPVANLMHYGDHDAEARFYTDALKAKFTSAGVAVPASLSEGDNRKTYWEEYFREPWSPVRHVQVKGYDFFLSNFMREGGRSSPKDLADQLAAAGLSATKPFFYSQHRYIGGTYRAAEEMWGGDDGTSAKALPAYPNCIALQGHTHYMISDDTGVWIEDFVTINNGALLNQAVGRCHENGVDISWYKTDRMRENQMPAIGSNKGHAGQVLSLFGDVVTLERRDFGSDQPYGPDIVFSVDPAKRAENRNAARRLRSAPPRFPEEAKVSVAQVHGKDRQKRATDQVVVSFPTVKTSAGHPRAYDYLVRFERLDGSPVASKRVYSPGANLPEALDADTTTCVFAKSELKGETELRVVVRPANAWGVQGCKKTTVCRL